MERLFLSIFFGAATLLACVAMCVYKALFEWIVRWAMRRSERPEPAWITPRNAVWFDEKPPL